MHNQTVGWFAWPDSIHIATTTSVAQMLGENAFILRDLSIRYKVKIRVIICFNSCRFLNCCFSLVMQEALHNAYFLQFKYNFHLSTEMSHTVAYHKMHGISSCGTVVLFLV